MYKDIHIRLSKHMLVDGFNLVFDLQKSHGSFIFDSKSKTKFLDFSFSFSTSALGYNHPQLSTPEFKEKLTYVAIN